VNTSLGRPVRDQALRAGLLQLVGHQGTSDMRIRGLTIPLFLLAGVTGCSSRISNITVAWNFGGGSCDGAGVVQVQIAISGEVLPQDTFDCGSGLVTFTEFYDGTYAVTVQGLDSTGAVTWTGSAQATVKGDTSVSVTLSPVSGQNAINYFSWTLDPAVGPGPAPQCGVGQRLDSIALYIDGDFNSGGYTYQCGDGFGSNVVISPYLTPGPHTLLFVAFDSTENLTSFAQSDELTVNFVTGSATTQTVTLHWNVGGLAVGYAPYASASNYPNSLVSCAASGIVDVVLDFIPSGQNPQTQSIDVGSNCNSSVALDNVYAGTVTPGARGYGPGGANDLRYIDNASIPPTPPQVTVTAGRFYVQGDTSFNVYIPMFPP
jgi:hypothetical protein